MPQKYSHDLCGQRFHKLLVIYNTTVYKNGDRYYLCRCDCGANPIVSKHQLIRGRTKSCGCYRREKFRLASQQRRGNRSSNWKGGITKTKAGTRTVMVMFQSIDWRQKRN